MADSGFVSFKRSTLVALVQTLRDQSIILGRMELRLDADASQGAEAAALLHKVEQLATSGDKKNDIAISKGIMEATRGMLLRLPEVEGRLADPDTLIFTSKEMDLEPEDDGAFTMLQIINGADFTKFAERKLKGSDHSAEAELRIWRLLSEELQKLVNRPTPNLRLRDCWLEAVKSKYFASAQARFMEDLAKDAQKERDYGRGYPLDHS